MYEPLPKVDVVVERLEAVHGVPQYGDVLGSRPQDGLHLHLAPDGVEGEDVVAGVPGHVLPGSLAPGWSSLIGPDLVQILSSHWWTTMLVPSIP